MIGWLALATTVLALGVLAACGDDGSGAGGGSGGGEATSSGTGGVPGPEDAVKTRFATFAAEGFTQVSRDPRETQHGNAATVLIWVSNDQVPDYKEIDPADDADTANPFPVGTMIVKQHLGEDGAPLGGATVLAKQAAGYAPETGDWLWARFGNDGALAESGPSGDVDYCIGCHQSNDLPRTDWLRGVDADNQL